MRFVDSSRSGSVIATFTLYFRGIDSFQMLLLQESIQDDQYLGKLKIIGANATFISTIGVYSKLGLKCSHDVLCYIVYHRALLLLLENNV